MPWFANLEYPTSGHFSWWWMIGVIFEIHSQSFLPTSQLSSSCKVYSPVISRVVVIIQDGDVTDTLGMNLFNASKMLFCFSWILPIKTKVDVYETSFLCSHGLRYCSLASAHIIAKDVWKVWILHHPSECRGAPLLLVHVVLRMELKISAC